MRPNDTNSPTILLAIELSASTWLVAARVPGSEKPHLHRIDGGDTVALLTLISSLQARVARRLDATISVVCCFEAGRDGFWLQRLLTAQGVDTHVLEPTSILINRRARRAKTDRLDAVGMLRVLAAYRSPAASPSAKARRTSLSGAIRPRRRYASQTQAASPMPTVTPKTAAALSTPAATPPNIGTSLRSSRKPYLRSPPDERASAHGAAELCEGSWRPRYAVAGRQRTQREGEDTGETAHADERDWNSTRSSGGGAIAINQRPGFRPYPVALGVSPRDVQCLKCSGPGFLEGEPKHLDPILMRRESVFGHSEVDRHKARRWPGQPVEQPALVG